MAEIPDNEVIALAKALLRQTILASGWCPRLPDAQRQKRIDQDVDQHRPLMLGMRGSPREGGDGSKQQA